MNLPVDFLRTFVRVVDLGSFTLAGQDVGRTQSAVSQQVKKLEEQAGRPLFDRSGRELLLTPAGEALLPYARRLVKTHDEAVSALSEPDMTGRVRMGILDDFAPYYLPPILEAFAADHPRVQVDVRCEYSSRALIRLLEGGELDLSVDSGAAATPGSRIIGRDPLVWVASRNHLAHEQDPLPVAVFDKNCLYRQWAMAALEKAGKPYRICYTSPSVSGVLAAVVAGLAVAPLGLSSVPSEMLILGEEHGVPPLPVSYIMVTHAQDAPGPVKRLAAAVEAGLGEGMAARRARMQRPQAPAPQGPACYPA